MNTFSFWKLYKNQWSWKNESKTFSIVLVCSLILSYAFVFTHVDSVRLYDVIVVWLSQSCVMMTMYQLLKGTVFAVYCYSVTYFAKEGDAKFITRYNEMMVWRK